MKKEKLQGETLGGLKYLFRLFGKTLYFRRCDWLTNEEFEVILREFEHLLSPPLQFELVVLDLHNAPVLPGHQRERAVEWVDLKSTLQSTQVVNSQ